MYRTSGIMTFRVESDITAPSMHVVPMLLVYWPGQLHDQVSVYESPLPSCLGNRSPPPAPYIMSVNSKEPKL